MYDRAISITRIYNREKYSQITKYWSNEREEYSKYQLSIITITIVVSSLFVPHYFIWLTVGTPYFIYFIAVKSTTCQSTVCLLKDLFVFRYERHIKQMNSNCWTINNHHSWRFEWAKMAYEFFFCLRFYLFESITLFACAVWTENSVNETPAGLNVKNTS